MASDSVDPLPFSHRYALHNFLSEDDRDMMHTVNKKTFSGTAVAVAAVAMAATPASATVFSYAATSASLGPLGQSIPGTDGSTVASVATTYDDVTEVFTWEATFNPGNDAASPHANGFTLVVNDGPMPKGHTGELAAIYFDATTPGVTPTVTAYAYNGADSATSFRYSNAVDDAANGNGTPDQIVTSINDPFVIAASSVDNADGTRTMRMELDATSINAHTPQQPSVDTMNGNAPLNWEGLRFANDIGIWFHSFDLTRGVQYDADGYIELGDGSLSSTGWWVASNYSAVDATSLTATVVPEPASLALAAGGLLMIVGRRRRRA